MDRTSVALVVLAALCAAPASAFLQDLLLPLQEVKHALHLQPQPAQPQYQYRRAVYEAPAAPAAPAVQQGYASTRPVLYQYLQPRPVAYETAYSYGSSNNPFGNFLQNSWFPWNSGNRQPVQPQLLSAQPQQLQQQQPLQAIWSVLPWNSHSQNGGQNVNNGNPVLSFLQNPIAVLPWSQQAQHRPGVLYTTPLAPARPASSPIVAQTLQLASESPAGPSSASSAALAAPIGVKPDGVVLDDSLAVQQLHDNGIRRIAVHQVQQDGQPCN